MTYHIVISDNLSRAGVELLQGVPEFAVTTGPLSRENALAAVADADALIVRSATQVDAEFIAVDALRRKAGWINDDRGPAPVRIEIQFEYR